jgi:hypothetical protein
VVLFCIVGVALWGLPLSLGMFYFFYIFNALGYVCGQRYP